jgi:hypothetical protein
MRRKTDPKDGYLAVKMDSILYKRRMISLGDT